jgi:hypothetical protein
MPIKILHDLVLYFCNVCATWTKDYFQAVVVVWKFSVKYSAKQFLEKSYTIESF